MRTYKRLRIGGGKYFFSANLTERKDNDMLIKNIDSLRAAFRQTRNDHPFEIDAIVILPEHLHCIWQLPLGDDDFPTRWRLIKARFRWLYRSMNAYPKAACAKASALGSFVNLTKLN